MLLMPNLVTTGCPTEIPRYRNTSAECHNVPGELPLSCAICDKRKQKRFCPAVHGRICPVCCGTEREVSLDCPGECPYLLQARKHENSDHLRDLDRETMFPHI